MRTLSPQFHLIVMAIEESKDMSDHEQRSLETHELGVIEKGAEKSIQKELDSQTNQKYSHGKKKQKKCKEKFNK